jgi:hypothetical protein
MAIPPTDIRILFTNYDIMTYFLNLASCSEHFISIKHRILATFNINQKKSILTAYMSLNQSYCQCTMSMTFFTFCFVSFCSHKTQVFFIF